jgi:hypothetical protein
MAPPRTPQLLSEIRVLDGIGDRLRKIKRTSNLTRRLVDYKKLFDSIYL